MVDPNDDPNVDGGVVAPTVVGAGDVTEEAALDTVVTIAVADVDAGDEGTVEAVVEDATFEAVVGADIAGVVNGGGGVDCIVGSAVLGVVGNTDVLEAVDEDIEAVVSFVLFVVVTTILL